MTRPQKGADPEWFCTLLDAARDVYFRYALLPERRFVYLSQSVEPLTGHRPDAFYADAALCLALIPREDRRTLRQAVRARRGLRAAIRLSRHDALIPLDLETAVVTRGRHVVAIEGVVRLAARTMTPGLRGPEAPGRGGTARPEPEPVQQRLTALMFEVHDLLHRVLPSSTMAARSQPPATLHLGDLVFDPARLAATESGTPVSLTSREALVLKYFLERPGRVVTRAQLLTDVWNYQYTGDDRTVDVHVSRLRRKLPSLRDRLVAIKHVGYRLDAEADAQIANF